MSTILALDTSTENCSAALSINGKVFVRELESPREHTKRILPMVDSLLAEAGIKLKDVDALAFGRGPGSFTGVRIGTGIAQGLAFGADLPMLPISTLAAMAQGAHRLHNVTDVLPAIDARMGEIYFAQYKLNESGVMTLVDNEIVVTPDDLIANFNHPEKAFHTLGTGWATYTEKLAGLNVEELTACEGIQFPCAQDMLVIAAAEFEKGNAVAPEDAMPVYVRDTVTWKKLPGRE
ncbi:tRNA (adenosine(37)-N6)-threonylcarbamoyltransferase complex dimerization subunit type 1 TsaB [Moritella sp. 24]|uniref:tRNA (adenosine(37)-N6)-threonylcarbamoyltransferase complex dimerization subunit type 1 TsaB n=1 Tax=Moritella sp. 24 TaxID=2746230 RepID=UPI001BA455EE|nr:tRNA (adenosine(37)-N6)-threonylcarbamoyltransferase complex dimerization subunit type 1 TsaB [Moritella sp. 24]QUM76577.1 tRNA (adenosine(37)-N6)-threonylcarbamoyltransferase complex dimerization subunit type 1 TsaB [Moritella sp. 24]